MFEMETFQGCSVYKQTCHRIQNCTCQGDAAPYLKVFGAIMKSIPGSVFVKSPHYLQGSISDQCKLKFSGNSCCPC